MPVAKKGRSIRSTGLNGSPCDHIKHFESNCMSKPFNQNVFSDEPNNYQGVEDCVALKKSTYVWNDMQCSLLKNFICKKPCEYVLVVE